MIAPQLKNHPFDFTCPRWMPAKVIRFCELINRNKAQDKDEEKGGEVIANNAANGAVIKDQPTETNGVVVANGNGYHNDQKA